MLLIFSRQLWPIIKQNQVSLALTVFMFGLFYVLFAWYYGAVGTAIRFIVPHHSLYSLVRTTKSGFDGLALRATTFGKNPPS